ncbi:putative quinol monooxygenase [Robertkochia flava]|uniref:putative quinol monooxygenase n=1 Tax=Robertkochia flava TaxID=3447986 RepID=UPI001CCD7F4D|nr:antibiotic biosynthesis monooxygenase family protein [Robertkochia marina]
MNYLHKFIALSLLISSFLQSCKNQDQVNVSLDTEKLKVRIAEIEIAPEFREEYLSILREESEASVRLEPGVICIYPMFQQDNPNLIRLLEIYESEEAYQSHLQTPHFKHYKGTTLKMVKSLELIDVEAIDPESMSAIFLKLKS